ncbi:MAG TPA: glycosyltransferase 87 family protein [Mycobacterium sp.]|nr:glycosyltransferase 87 family protein [Mycobacterium sp.]
MSSPTDVPAHPDSAACAIVGAPTGAPPQRRGRWWLAVALLASAGIATIYHSFHGFLDLDVYRLGVRQWLNGGDLYGTLPATHDGARLPFIYPPFAAVALSPIALIPWSAARVVNFSLAVAALGVTIYLSTRRLLPTGNRQDALLVSGLALPLALWLEPVRETIGFGQINLILMALVAADCLVDKPRWPRGALTGIAAAIKLTPAVFLLYFLVRRDIRASVVTIVSAALATAAGFAVLPRESLRYWFGGFAGAAGISGSPYATNQTVKAALARLGLPPLVESGLWLLVAAVVLAAAVAGTWWALRSCNAVLAMVVTATAGVLLSPTSWSHHWVWIVPALLAMVVESVQRRSAGWLVATVLTTSVFFIGAHNFFPKGGGRELAWSPGEHLLGDSYVLLALALLIVWTVPAVRPAWCAARPLLARLIAVISR